MPASAQCVGPLLLDEHGGADVDRFSTPGQCATAMPLSPVPQGISERVASSSVFGIGYADSFWSIVLGCISGVLHLWANDRADRAHESNITASYRLDRTAGPLGVLCLCVAGKSRFAAGRPLCRVRRVLFFDAFLALPSA
jgi:hypothetical protein